MPSSDGHDTGTAADGNAEAAATSRALTIGDAIRLAVRLHQGGQLDTAEEVYRRVLESAPEQADALHFLGLIAYQRGRVEEALGLVRRAVEAAPEHVDAHNNLGNMLYEQGILAEAEAAYRAVLVNAPRHAGAQTNLGVLLRKRGDEVGAEAAFRRAIEMDASHGPAYHNLGNLLRDTARTEQALAAFRQALLLSPYDGDSYRHVGALLSTLGRLEEAAEIYQRWLEADPTNPVARHMYAACAGREIPARATDAFVKQTFDVFAESFDAQLERLSYRAPALVADAVAVAVGAGAAASLEVLDAGAGTGLCGPLLRPYARALIGVDLSAGMLKKAAARGCYDRLEVAELTAYLADREAAFDVVVSADTLVYFGELGPFAAAARRALRANGVLVFTVERGEPPPGPPGYVLAHHGRYVHGEPYVRETLAAAGFHRVNVGYAELRTEHKKSVAGLVITARR